MFRTTSMMIWAISFIAFALPVFADGGGNWIIHENPAPGEGYSEQSTIQMTAEYVDIVLHPEYVQVSAVFEFENTGPECSIGMVFPLDGALQPVGGWDGGWGVLQEKYPDANWYQGMKKINGVWYENEYVYIKPEDVESDFQVTVDDSTPLDYSLIELLPTGVSTITGYAEWYLNFDAGQNRELACSYTSGYGAGGESFIFNDFFYFLGTGSFWKGPIGYGKLTIRPGMDFADQWRRNFLFYESPGLPPAQDLGDQIVWEFENLEPVYQETEEWDIHNDNRSGIKIYLIRDSIMVYEHIEPWSFDEYGLGCPGKILAPFGINFRTEPDSNSPTVPGKETLAKDLYILVLERNGDWYYVLTRDNYYGWVRWRYVDPESGEEFRYIDLELENWISAG